MMSNDMVPYQMLLLLNKFIWRGVRVSDVTIMLPV